MLKLETGKTERCQKKSDPPHPPYPQSLIAMALNTNINVENFLVYLCNERQASEHTIVNYAMDIEQFANLTLNSSLEKANWQRTDVYQARSFIVALQKKNLARTTILRKISSLRSFFRFLVRENVTDSNPFIGITSPKKGKKHISN